MFFFGLCFECYSEISNYANDSFFEETKCWVNDSIWNDPPCTDAYYKTLSMTPREVFADGANWYPEFFVQNDDWQIAYLAAIRWVISQRWCNPDIWNQTLEWRYNHSGLNESIIGDLQIDTRWVGSDWYVKNNMSVSRHL